MGRKNAYKMSSKPRGLFLIVNNYKFTCGMKERVGGDRDAENLFRLFNWLGFITIRKDNLTGSAMRREFEVSLAMYIPSTCTLSYMMGAPPRTSLAMTTPPMTV